MSIGKNIRERRRARGLTQEQLSEEIGTSRQHLGKVEIGKNGLSVEKLVKIARVLGCTVDDLCRENEN